MLLDPRILIMFGANALLLYLSCLVNSTLAALPCYLILFGPMLVLPSLYMRHRSYFLCTLLSGLWVDAALPSTFGFFTISFLIAGALICFARIRFRAEHNYHPILLAHASNAFFILLLTLSADFELLKLSNYWIQVVFSLLLSHLALFLIAPWFFNLQRLLLELFHFDSQPEDFPIQ